MEISGADAKEQFDFTGFRYCGAPFSHWINERAISVALIREINAQWPYDSDLRWRHETGSTVGKSSMLFPSRLPPAAQALSEELYSPDGLRQVSEMVGESACLLADPWFLVGPDTPKVGGGLHSIPRMGFLGMHLDFDMHPSGLERTLNLLLYLNEDWDDAWGGALELGEGDVSIYPRAGMAVVFRTTGESWHGHPYPLNCPSNRTRRSLALYFYRPLQGEFKRRKTVYRKMGVA